jgi:hypothetical protein
LASTFFWPFSKELKMTALTALQSITLDEASFVPCACRAVPMPLEISTPAKRANDLLAASLKLARADRLLRCGFYPALNCCDGFVHSDVEVAEPLISTARIPAN